MCHIFSSTHLYNQSELDNVKRILSKHNERGPEDYQFKSIGNTYMAFHRLAINGLNKRSTQPFIYKHYTMICNGEVYNHKDLWNYVDIERNTESDCEVILPLVIKYGVKQASAMIDGVFSFCIYDDVNKQFFISRDPLGVRPLYMFKDNQHLFGVSSTMNPIIDLNDNGYLKGVKINVWKNGVCGIYNIDSDELQQETYWTPYSLQSLPFMNNIETICNGIRKCLIEAVKKRVDTTDRPIACLLSGGLDSSLICSIVQKLSPYKIETYSIGFEGSPDLLYARKVAKYLGTKHNEVICKEEDFLNAIPKVIERIGSYDTTTVRASVGNYLVCKYISEHSSAKVIFNGDGSDEVCGGYLYFHHSPTTTDFDIECKRLLDDIHRFDGLRSDRCISSHGLEARTPFLDKTFIQYYLSIPSIIRKHSTIEKYLLRKSFERNYLPDEILWRTKEAFSDGVSQHTRSWYEIIQEYLKDKNINIDCDYNHPETKEQKYYRILFNSFFDEKNSDVIPYFWMPKFVNATDSSARTLSTYKIVQSSSS